MVFDDSRETDNAEGFVVVSRQNVALHLGQAAGVAFVFAIMLVVAILRALGETAYYPWSQEFIPNGVRGRYSAIFIAVSTFASALALIIAGKVIASGAGLNRYLWVQTGLGDDPRFAGGLTIYDAPEPWGPWTTVFATERWDVGPGETASFPPKWMSPDGRTLYLVFSGDDCFSVRRAEFLATPRADSR